MDEAKLMKILVTGDRNWKKFGPIRRELQKFPKGTIVVHGDARGADTCADFIAKSLGLIPKPYPADWNLYKKAAGPIRNRQMLKENPDVELVLAFHEHIEESKGTKDMIEIAENAGIFVKLFKK